MSSWRARTLSRLISDRGSFVASGSIGSSRSIRGRGTAREYDLLADGSSTRTKTRSARSVRNLARLAEVGEGDLFREAKLDDLAEEALERRRVVGQVLAIVGETSPQQLDHERLELEVLVVAGDDPFPPLGDSNQLSERRSIGDLAVADELQMQGDTSEHAVSGVLAHQVAPIVWVAFVKHRYDVYVQPAPLEVDADAVLLGNELIPVHVRVGLVQAVRQPGHQQCVTARRRRSGLHVHGGVQVVDTLQGRALGNAARMEHLDQPVVRVGIDLLLKAISQGLDLGSVLGGSLG